MFFYKGGFFGSQIFRYNNEAHEELTDFLFAQSLFISNQNNKRVF